MATVAMATGAQVMTALVVAVVAVEEAVAAVAGAAEVDVAAVVMGTTMAASAPISAGTT